MQCHSLQLRVLAVFLPQALAQRGVLFGQRRLAQLPGNNVVVDHDGDIFRGSFGGVGGMGEAGECIGGGGAAAAEAEDSSEAAGGASGGSGSAEGGEEAVAGTGGADPTFARRGSEHGSFVAERASEGSMASRIPAPRGQHENRETR